MYPLKEIRITSPYGERASDRWHYGCDFGVMPKGTTHNNVMSIDDGIVKVSKNNPGGYGEYMIIEYDGFCMLIAHLYKRFLKVGTVVKRGEILALTGNTPLSRNLAEHLHAEIRDVPYDHPEFWSKKTVHGRPHVPIHCVNPIPYFEEPEQEWGEEAWNWATERNIVDGTRPYDVPTREEMVQMLHNYNRR